MTRFLLLWQSNNRSESWVNSKISSVPYLEKKSRKKVKIMRNKKVSAHTFSSDFLQLEWGKKMIQKHTLIEYKNNWCIRCRKKWCWKLHCRHSLLIIFCLLKLHMIIFTSKTLILVTKKFGSRMFRSRKLNLEQSTVYLLKLKSISNVNIVFLRSLANLLFP